MSLRSIIPDDGVTVDQFREKIAAARSIAELDRLMCTEWAWVKCTLAESGDLMRLILAFYTAIELDIEGGCPGGRSAQMEVAA